MFFLQATAESSFDGFHGISLVLLVAAVLAVIGWGVLVAVVWVSTRPRLPRAGTATLDLGPESPALVNFLVNGWSLNRNAAAATLTDLAARRILGLEDYVDARHVVRIRSNQPPGETMNPYEKHVFELMRRRATGGSAPVEALDIGEGAESHRWWKRFRELVEAEAREKGYATGRWSARHRLLVSASLAIPFALAAAAFALADVNGGSHEDAFTRWEWFVVAAIAWVAANGGFKMVHGYRDTAKGREASARWLGVREALRQSRAFPDLPPGAVAVWERYLSYAVATGVARGVIRVLPFAADDPSRAWSRYGGEWHQIRIRYPRRFGYGQAPWKVFLSGLGLTLVCLFVGILVIPTVARLAWEIGRELLADAGSLNSRSELGLLAGIAVALAIPAIYTAFWVSEGLGRLILGARDLNRTITVTGEVANYHLGQVALADGVHRKVKAFRTPVGAPYLRRGHIARVTMTPHLQHIRKVEVLEDAPPLPPELRPERTATTRGAAPIAAAAAVTPIAGLSAAMVTRAMGVPLQAAESEEVPSANGQPQVFAHTFSDGQDGSVRVFMTPALGGMGGAFLSLLSRLPRGQALEVAGKPASWIGERILSVNLDGRMLAIDVELPQLDEPARRDGALALAHAVVQQPATENPAPGLDAASLST